MCETVVIIITVIFLLAGIVLSECFQNMMEGHKKDYHNKTTKVLDDFFLKHQNFNPDEKFIEPFFGLTHIENVGKGIAIDKKKKLIALIGPACHLIKAKDIIEVSVTEDGQKVIETSRSSQITGAFVGGVLMGGTGAVIGGLSGKQKVTNEVSSVGLKIIWNNLNAPEHCIRFFWTDGKPVRKNPEYSRAIGEAEKWHNILKVLMRTTISDTNCEQEETKDRLQIKMESCKNCDGKIGRYETAYLYNQVVVCEVCYNKLLKRSQ